MAKTKNRGKDVESQTNEQVTPDVVISGDTNDTPEEKTVQVEEPLLKNIEVDVDGTGIETASDFDTFKEKADEKPLDDVENIGIKQDTDDAKELEESISIGVSEGSNESDVQDLVDETEAEFLLAPYEQKKTIKKLKGFLIGIGVLGIALAVIVGVLYTQLDKREGIIKTTQNELLETQESLTAEQTDAEKVSKLVIEQQEKITQYEADIEQYKLVVAERDKEIEKLKAIQAETNTKVTGLETQLKEMSETFEKFKSDILGIVEE